MKRYVVNTRECPFCMCGDQFVSTGRCETVEGNEALKIAQYKKEMAKNTLNANDFHCDCHTPRITDPFCLPLL